MSSKVVGKSIGPYRIDCAGDLSTEQLHGLISEIARKSFSCWSSVKVTSPVVESAYPLALGGRSPVWRATLPSIGPVVMKPYYRGGILRHLVQRTYIGFGPSRSTRELYLLCRVRELGVAAPEPVAALTHGGLFYRAWLVTKEIPEAKTLADLMLHDEERGRAAMEKLVPHVSKLVQNRILHVDLHPGNVLVGNDDAVYIVDFDKARDYVGAVPKLRDHYVLRWRRAVLKHGLPDLLSEMMSLGLRRTTSA